MSMVYAGPRWRVTVGYEHNDIVHYSDGQVDIRLRYDAMINSLLGLDSQALLELRGLVDDAIKQNQISDKK